MSPLPNPVHPNRTWHVTEDEVPQLVDRMFDPSRNVCLVIVSPASDVQRPRLDVEALRAALPDQTELAVLATMGVSVRLSDMVGQGLQCYGGAVRVVRPGANPEDLDFRHPLVTVYDHTTPKVARNKVLSAVHSASQPARPFIPALSSQQESALARFRSTLPEGNEAVAAPDPATPPPKPVRVEAPKPGPRPVAPPHEANRRLSEDDLERLSSIIDSRIVHALGQVTEQLREAVQSGNHAFKQARARAERAERELAKAKGRTSSPARSDLPTVYSEPEKQLRFEVDYEWLTGTPEAERVPLRPWTVTDDFISGLTAQIVPRRKTVQVIVDILTGQVWSRRECKQFTDGPGNSQQRTRSDGAVAYRAYVKTNSPGAPRLMWWELPDGTVELSHVGHHDDLI